ncbi:hypothetical protein C3Y87_10075 [Carbonactinospora thermoautotrophica]|uniref:DUF2637 domain-containing protein n=1 Tax=Carbonactinospora thermoautotrophica TaxID=1469144 RepID=UPI00226F692E|nr:DUF2637 domain-containing protein [Carbonactinospora thermoautotrophica]MCX9191756.1 hypothetical protein [Carbonactinospora thermoautotrophica]
MLEHKDDRPWYVRLLGTVNLFALAGISGCVSFTHIHDTAVEHGMPDAFAWAVAVSVDILAVQAGLEVQRDRKLRRRYTLPLVVIIAAVVLSLAANLAQAEGSPWGYVMAAWPAVAFMAIVKMLLRRAVPGVPLPEPVEEDDAIDFTEPVERLDAEKAHAIIREGFLRGIPAKQVAAASTRSVRYVYKKFAEFREQGLTPVPAT